MTITPDTTWISIFYLFVFEENNLMLVSVTVRIMTLISAFLICLAVKISCAAKLQCPNAVNCICGNKEESVTVCAPEDSVETEVCARLSNCESCQEGLNACFKCPEGFEGSFCTRRLIKFRQKRQFRLSDRSYVQQRPGSHSTQGARSCPFLDSSDMESIECVQTNTEEQTCIGKCWKGYHFIVLDYRTEITLTCRRGVWAPLDSFPKCRRNPVEELMYCADPGINANSFRQPSKPPDSRGFRQGSRLVYSCDRGYDVQGERNIFCLTSGEWSEDRPRCVPQSAAPVGTRGIDLIFCPDPGMNAHSFRKQSTQPSSRGYPHGSQVEYICDQGYALSGERSVVCLATGKWTASIPTCVSESPPQGPWNLPQGTTDDPDYWEETTFQTTELESASTYAFKDPRKSRSTRNAPDLCEDAAIDTVTQTESGNTYVFKGEFYWKVLPSGTIAEGYPRKISDDWDDLVGNLDASVTLPTGKTYFFKGRHYWRFTNKKMDRDFPKLISAGFKGIPDNLDAGVVWSGNRKIYFFKGNKYWQYDDSKDPPVGMIYPLPITEWSHFLVGGINAALQWKNNRTYFFKGDLYYRYNDTASEVDSDSPYPLPTATEWFGCR